MEIIWSTWVITCRLSEDNEAREVIRVFIKTGIISLRVFGVFATMVFQTCRAAWRYGICKYHYHIMSGIIYIYIHTQSSITWRTEMLTSVLTIYRAESISSRFSRPRTSIIARPWASVLAPSSSLPPSSNALPEVPATWEIEIVILYTPFTN